MTVKIVLVEYQRLFRRGLSALLSNVKDFRVVADTGEPELALKLVAETTPDVLLAGISLAGINGLQLIEVLHKKFPDLHLMVLTTYSSGHFVRRALRGGACGYLLKDIDEAELEIAIREVMEGHVYISRSLAAEVITDASLAKREQDLGLTERQLEVLELIAESYSLKAIADRLHISVKTVESHRSRLMQRTGVQDVAGLVKFAIRKGLINVD